MDVLRSLADGDHVLLSAPTGGGKTLAGFLPSLVDLADGGSGRLHTLYVSPLKALTTDIERNLAAPHRRDGAADQGRNPHRRHARRPSASASRTRRPDILLTTPESGGAHAVLPRRRRPLFAGDLRHVVLDELHAWPWHEARRPAGARSGAAEAYHAPDLRTHRAVGHGGGRARIRTARLPRPRAESSPARATGAAATGDEGAPVDRILTTSKETRVPWSGHIWRVHALAEVYERDRVRHRDHADRVRQHPRPGRDACSRNSGS